MSQSPSRNIKSQISRIWVSFGIAILISLGGVGFTILVAKLTDNSLSKLANDPAQTMNFPPYIGMLSNWGIILWTMSAAICLFSAVLLKQHKASDTAVRFIAISGAFSLLLGIDDLYLLHDWLFPKLFHLSENKFYLLYVFVFLAYIIYFIPQILRYEYLLFGAALFFFLLSRGIYEVLPFFGRFRSTGDILKYFGIVFWLTFFYRTALHEVSAVISLPKNNA